MSDCMCMNESMLLVQWGQVHWSRSCMEFRSHACNTMMYLQPHCIDVHWWYVYSWGTCKLMYRYVPMMCVAWLLHVPVWQYVSMDGTWTQLVCVHVCDMIVFTGMRRPWGKHVCTMQSYRQSLILQYNQRSPGTERSELYHIFPGDNEVEPKGLTPPKTCYEASRTTCSTCPFLPSDFSLIRASLIDPSIPLKRAR